MYDEELTLADVMEAVDEYITEKEGSLLNRAAGKAISSAGATVHGLSAVTLGKGAIELNKKADKKSKEFTDNIRELKETKQKIKKAINAKDPEGMKQIADLIDKEAKLKKQILRSGAATLGYGAGTIAAGGMAVGQLKSALNMLESVDDLRLRVYEAAEAGLIDNDEKSTMLNYLNLDNYEEAVDPASLAKSA